MIRLRTCIKKISRALHAPKLQAGIDSIRNAPLEDLRDPLLVEKIVQRTGLHYDRRGLYGRDARYMNLLSSGLWQIPRQFAEALVFLSTFRIGRALEIGSCDGWTACLLCAYLQRFNPDLSFESIDIENHLDLPEPLLRSLPITFSIPATSDAYADRTFDFVFIDGDHSLQWVARDYANTGRKAPIVMFHDINDLIVRTYPSNEGGVPAFWNRLKAEEASSSSFFEATFHSENREVMGIGIRTRPSS